MTNLDFFAVLPLIILVAWACLLLLAEPDRHRLSRGYGCFDGLHGSPV